MPVCCGDNLSEVTLYQLQTILYNCAGLARSPLLCYMSTWLVSLWICFSTVKFKNLYQFNPRSYYTGDYIQNIDPYKTWQQLDNGLYICIYIYSTWNLTLVARALLIRAELSANHFYNSNHGKWTLKMIFKGNGCFLFPEAVVTSTVKESLRSTKRGSLQVLPVL